MKVRSKITKIFAAVILLVACDPDKGGENTGGGDAIFTEGVTLAELTEKINAAESFVVSGNYTYISSTGTYIDNTWEYRLDGETFYSMYDEGSAYYECSYSADGYYYEASMEADDSIKITKILSDYYGEFEEYASDLLDEFKEFYVLDCLKEVDGKIVFNEKFAHVDSDDYVEGSGYVRFKGNTMEYGWQLSGNRDGETTTYNCAVTVSLVNAYSFKITPELKEAEKTATWAEYVSYNGVIYRKAVDETTGEEYYYVSSADDGAVAETTINTLPVKPRQ